MGWSVQNPNRLVWRLWDYGPCGDGDTVAVKPAAGSPVLGGAGASTLSVADVGKWAIIPAAGTDGQTKPAAGNITAGFQIFTDPGNVFTAADVGKVLTIQGAGTNGGAFASEIIAGPVAGSAGTQVILKAAASTTVTNANYTYASHLVGQIIAAGNAPLRLSVAAGCTPWNAPTMTWGTDVRPAWDALMTAMLQSGLGTGWAQDITQVVQFPSGISIVATASTLTNALPDTALYVPTTPAPQLSGGGVACNIYVQGSGKGATVVMKAADLVVFDYSNTLGGGIGRQKTRCGLHDLSVDGAENAPWTKTLLRTFYNQFFDIDAVNLQNNYGPGWDVCQMFDSRIGFLRVDQCGNAINLIPACWWKNTNQGSVTTGTGGAMANGGNILTDTGAAFTGALQGQWITVVNAAAGGNNTTGFVQAVLSATQLQLSSTCTVTGGITGASYTIAPFGISTGNTNNIHAFDITIEQPHGPGLYMDGTSYDGTFGAQYINQCYIADLKIENQVDTVCAPFLTVNHGRWNFVKGGHCTSRGLSPAVTSPVDFIQLLNGCGDVSIQRSYEVGPTNQLSAATGAAAPCRTGVHVDGSGSAATVGIRVDVAGVNSPGNGQSVALVEWVGTNTQALDESFYVVNNTSSALRSVSAGTSWLQDASLAQVAAQVASSYLSGRWYPGVRGVRTTPGLTFAAGTVCKAYAAKIDSSWYGKTLTGFAINCTQVGAIGAGTATTFELHMALIGEGVTAGQPGTAIVSGSEVTINMTAAVPGALNGTFAGVVIPSNAWYLLCILATNGGAVATLGTYPIVDTISATEGTGAIGATTPSTGVQNGYSESGQLQVTAFATAVSANINTGVSGIPREQIQVT